MATAHTQTCMPFYNFSSCLEYVFCVNKNLSAPMYNNNACIFQLVLARVPQKRKRALLLRLWYVSRLFVVIVIPGTHRRKDRKKRKKRPFSRASFNKGKYYATGLFSTRHINTCIHIGCIHHTRRKNAKPLVFQLGVKPNEKKKLLCGMKSCSFCWCW